jgi:hypothetical protein
MSNNISGGEWNKKRVKVETLNEAKKNYKIMNNFYDNAFNMLIFLTQANG